MRSTKPASAFSSPRDPTKAGFLSLPGELRNRVYHLALIEESGPIVLNARDKGEFWDQKYKSLQVGLGKPALLRLCRQVYNECSRIYYEQNTFCFSNETLKLGALQAFRYTIGPSIEMLRRIVVNRSYQIGSTKQIQIRFEAYISDKKRIVIIQPQNERMPFPGIKTKIRGKLYEPCRCEVTDLADAAHCGKHTSGDDLIYFLETYVQLITSTAEHAEIEICEKCSSVRRT